MSDQHMEMQFADPDWQPASSRLGRSPSEQALFGPVEIKNAPDPRPQASKQPPAPVRLRSRRTRRLLALVARVALLVIWLTTPLVTRAFHGGWIVPLLGVLFLPFTALTYTVVSALAGSVTGLGWLWVAVALLLDLTWYGGQTSKRRSGLPQQTLPGATLSNLEQ